MIADFGMWIADSRRRTMQGIRISSHFGMNLKSALRNLHSAIMMCAMLFALCVSAQAQQPGKIFRIGFLDPSTASGSADLWEAFRQELSRLGWIEGKTIAIEYRFAENKIERLPELAADLVRLKVDLIVVAATPSGLAAKSATTTIPS